MLTLLIAGALTLAQTTAPMETPVTLTADPAPLHGTLLQPTTGVRAAAVIIPGSGPTDRDGNNRANGTPIQVVSAPLRQLAEGLADRGVATLRIDKRGVGQSVAAGADEAALTFDAMIDDAHAWAAEAARRTGRPCAWIIGHSEGALVALGATRRPDDRICGLVLLSGAGKPAADAIALQLAGLPEPMKGQALHALDDLRAGRTTDNVPGLEALFRPRIQPYLISWFALDPRALAAAYDGPLLIAQGTHDVQIPVEDAQALKAARPDARLVLWDGLSHLLAPAPADRAGNMATYSDPELRAAPEVVRDVADFILQPR